MERFPPGTKMTVSSSNQPSAATPAPAVRRPAGAVSVDDGSGHTSGPICTVEVALRPMEVQILAPE